MTKTILILGGGVGGLVAARELRALVPSDYRIILVEREPVFVFQSSLLWLVTGDRSLDKISRPLARLERKGIEVVRGEIERIDAGQREAVVDGRALKGDFLIIALGAELGSDQVPGLALGGHNLYSPQGADALRRALDHFRGGRLALLTAAPGYKCPAAPYEAAMLLESWSRKRRIRERTQIDLYAAEPGPMPVAGIEVSNAVREIVLSKGIGYHPNHSIEHVDPEARRLSFTDGTEEGYDLLAYVPPHRAPRVVREAGLVEEGWIPVDRRTLSTRFEGVYAVGDVTSIPLSAGKPLPKAGVFAHAQAEVVARNIAYRVMSKGHPVEFDGEGECFLESGDGRAGFAKGNFFTEPAPTVKMHPPGRHWHAAKVLFEKQWLHRWL